MPNYQNGKIYTIRSHQTEDIYIGSTVQPLTKRLSDHKKDYKRYKNDKYGYTSSYEIIQYEDAYIELYESYPCNNREELLRREGELIRELDCVNKVITGRTKKEYVEENKEKITEYQKKYRNDKKEILLQKKKLYYNKNKNQIIEYQKKYRDENKEIIKQKYKQYYQKNKEKIKERDKQYYQKNSEKIKCECGSIIVKIHLKIHNKTKKHINYVNSKTLLN